MWGMENTCSAAEYALPKGIPRELLPNDRNYHGDLSTTHSTLY